MRKTILIITLGLLLALSSCDNTTSGEVGLPDWMYSTEVKTEAELKDALKGTSEDKEIIVSVPAGTTIEVKDTIDVSGKNVKLIISDKAEITSDKTIFSIPSGSTMTIEGQGTLDAGSQEAIISNAGSLIISGGSYTTTGSVVVDGSGSVTVSESSSASFTVSSTGTVFGSSATLSIKGGTYNVKLSADLCAIGYMAQPVDEDSKEYKVKWSDAKIVADIINGLSQEKVQADLAQILSSLNPDEEEQQPSAGGNVGENETPDDGTETPTPASLAARVDDGSLTITGTAPSFKLTFNDYDNGFKDPDFATIASGTADMTITAPTSTSTDGSYTISCTNVTVEVDGHTVVINLASSTGDIEINKTGTDTQIQIMYPTVGEGALKVKSDNGSQNTVVWADVDDLLDDQASVLPSTPAGSGSTGN